MDNAAILDTPTLVKLDDKSHHFGYEYNLSENTRCGLDPLGTHIVVDWQNIKGPDQLIRVMLFVKVEGTRDSVHERLDMQRDDLDMIEVRPLP